MTQRFEEYDPQGRLTFRRPPSVSSRRTPVATYAILAICCTAYAVCNLGIGGVPNELMLDIRSGSLFPGVITSMFMHADIGHLACNMLVLYFFGILMERQYGTPRYLALYFGAGIIADLAQCLHVPGPSLGASAALSGISAAFIRHYPHARILLFFVLPMPAWVFGVFWLLFNVAGMIGLFPMNWGFTAHAVGLLAGFALSYMLVPPGESLDEA